MKGGGAARGRGHRSKTGLGPACNRKRCAWGHFGLMYLLQAADPLLMPGLCEKVQAIQPWGTLPPPVPTPGAHLKVELCWVHRPMQAGAGRVGQESSWVGSARVGGPECRSRTRCACLLGWCCSSRQSGKLDDVTGGFPSRYFGQSMDYSLMTLSYTICTQYTPLMSSFFTGLNSVRAGICIAQVEMEVELEDTSDSGEVRL